MKKFSSLFYTGLTILLIPTLVIFILAIAAILHKPVNASTIEVVAEVVVPKTVIVHDTVFIPKEEVVPTRKKKTEIDSIPKRLMHVDTLIQKKDTI
jgi:hypothetical protein